MSANTPRENHESDANRQLVDVTEQDLKGLNGFCYTVKEVPAKDGQSEQIELRGLGRDQNSIYHTLVVDELDGRIYLDTSVRGLDRRPASAIADAIERQVRDSKNVGNDHYGHASM